jgi:hypothetical protein
MADPNVSSGQVTHMFEPMIMKEMNARLCKEFSE